MKYRSEIDGLRAIAVLPVILFHAGFSAFGGGYVGVDVFFVISGYLITTLLIEDVERGRFSLLGFYERRARRILPALFLVMLACIPFAWVWMLPDPMRDFSQSLVAVTLFASNMLFWKESGYFAAASEEKPLLHTWSLAVEEQYYILFPLFLFLAWRFGRQRVFWLLASLALFSLVLSEWASHIKPAANFYLAPMRAWELLAGSLVAFWLQKRGMRSHNMLAALGLAMILYSVFAFDKTLPFPGVYALIPVLGTVLVIAFADASTLTAKLLSLRPMMAIGLISYSAYLWHQPVFAFARIRFFEQLNAPWMLLLGLMSLALAALSWRYVEQPFRQKGRFSRQQIFGFSALGVLFFAAFGVAGHFSAGYAFRVSPEISQLLSIQQTHDRLRDDGGCNRQDDEFHLARCVFGNPEHVDMALVGDSHAAALAQPLGLLAERKGRGVVSYTKNACPFVIGIRSRGDENCAQFVQAVLEDLRSQKQIRTIVVAGRMAFYLNDGPYHNGLGGIENRSQGHVFTAGNIDLSAPLSQRNDAVLEAYENTIRQLSNEFEQQDIILLKPIPEQAWNVPQRMAKSMFIGLEPVPNLPRTTYDQRHEQLVPLYERLNQLENVTVIDSAKALCTSEICLAAVDGEPLYYDDDHLSQQGAKRVLQLMVNEIEELKNE